MLLKKSGFGVVFGGLFIVQRPLLAEIEQWDCRVQGIDPRRYGCATFDVRCIEQFIRRSERALISRRNAVHFLRRRLLVCKGHRHGRLIDHEEVLASGELKDEAAYEKVD